MTQPYQLQEASPRTPRGKGQVLFNEIFPLEVQFSSAAQLEFILRLPSLSYFRAVLMFYDSFLSFLLGGKKKSQPRHSVLSQALQTADV